jgi:2-oxoglutarate ferredoxin oxidoreductase subunit delta
MPLRIWRTPLDAYKVKVAYGEIHIIKDRCKECGFCIEFCPIGVLEMSDEYNTMGYHPPKVKEDSTSKCICCGLCEIICPDFAIFNVEKSESPAEPKDEQQ